MVEDFDSKYARIHAELQENSELVKRIYHIAREKGLKSKGEKNYFSCGVNNKINIGLDLQNKHNWIYFNEILAKMRLLYEMLEGKVDLSRVYAQLDDKFGRLDDKFIASLGIISEDMSCGGKYKIEDSEALDLIQIGLHDLLSKIFIEEEIQPVAIARTTFNVLDKNNKSIRRPIVDLDHVDVKPKYKKIFEKYCEQYYSDERFRIHEV